MVICSCSPHFRDYVGFRCLSRWDINKVEIAAGYMYMYNISLYMPMSRE